MNTLKILTFIFGMMIEIVFDQREIRSKGKARLDLREIEELILETYFINPGGLNNYIGEISLEYGFDANEAIHEILNGYNGSIKSLSCLIQILFEYLDKHKDKRKPDKNDYHDINHMKFLPYFDYYVCERFFAELSRKIAPTFDTKVCRNLVELKDSLEQS